MDKSEARSILLNPQMHSTEEVQEAARLHYPNTTSMRPPRPPPDNTPDARDTIRYPQMAKQTGKQAQYDAAVHELAGEVAPPAGMDVTTLEGRAQFAAFKSAAENAGLSTEAANKLLAEIHKGRK